MPRYLFIVARDQTDLWAHLAREFTGDPGVEVFLDRRRVDRRRDHGSGPMHGERRRGNRRSRPPIHHELASMNFALVQAD